MSIDFESTLFNLNDLDFWFKVQDNEPLSLADVHEILHLRWPYFRDNWEFIKEDYINTVETYSDPDRLRSEIDSFNDFIHAQRTSSNKRNPFDTDDILIRFFTILDITPIDNINLSREEQNIVDSKISKIKLFTRGDFLEIRSTLEEERDAIADRASATDVDYNRIFNRSAQTARVDIKNKDINKMFELQEAIKAVNFILANSFALDTSAIDPFALARANANNSAIDIQSYNSGFLVKLNYGEDLQALALRTLGDTNKWIDIAIANGLKPPYIDEIGEKISLISNATGNQINIASINITNELNIDKLSIGQAVFLQSNVETFPEQRSILNIREIPISGEIIIELSGNTDLNRYKISDNAYMRIYKQNTINSSFFILIPSLELLDDENQSSIPWFLTADNIVEIRQKVDLNIDDNGNLNFDSTGDLQLSYGLENSVQAIKLKISVEEGELRQHPEFGLLSVVGYLNVDISTIKEALVDSIVANIASDERFSGVDRLDIVYSSITTNSDAASLEVILVVRLTESGQLVPINFSVKL